MYNKHRNLSFAIAGLLLMAFSSFSHAEDRKVGVAVTAVINGNPGTGPEVSEALGSAIETVLKATVIAGSESQNLLPVAARSETCLGDSACLVAAGKALGVDELLMLIIIDSDEEVKVEATWVDVASGKTALRPSISASKSSDTMAELFLANASILLPDVELRPEEKGDIEVPVDTTNDNNATSYTPNTGNADTGSSAGERHWTPLTKTLLIGGGVTLAASIGYGIYRFSSVCDGRQCDNNDLWPTRLLPDLIGVAGAGAMAYAYWQYTKSDTLEAPPVALNVTSDSVGLSLGGRF